jgi:KDO2-lipid IV(A) lauroyltransferase
MPYQPKHVLEYVVVRLMGAVLGLLPHRAALAVGWCVAALAFHVFRFRRTETFRRIRSVLGSELSPARIRWIAWISLRNNIFNIVEMVKNNRIDRAYIQRSFVNHDYLPPLVAHCGTGRGAVLAVPHMGSWETAAIACHLNGIPIFSLAATQKNPLTDSYLNYLRRRPGIETIARGSGVMKDVLRKLKSGDVLAILPDVRMKTPGVLIPFLGGQANIGEGMAVFARHAGIPVFPAMMHRIGWARHESTMFDPVWPDKTLDKDVDVRRMTMAVLANIDREIRLHPEQWFWYNKRWILDPIDR